jgi:hypothetical protein
MKLLLIVFLMSGTCFAQEFEGGFIKVKGTGGTSPFTYSLDGSAYQTKDTFFNVVAGQHIVNTKDAKNCIKTSSCRMYNTISMKAFVWNGLTYIDAEQYILSPTNAFTSVRLQATGGKAPYYYSLNSTTKYTLNKIYWNGLKRNVIHTFRVKDALGYIYFINITL